MKTATPMLLLFLFVSACKLSCLAPQAEVLDAPIAAKLEQGRQSGQGTFDHSRLDALLKEHVLAEEGRVDYAALADDEAELDTYLSSLGEVELSELSGEAQKALLINAYNAFTLKLILEHYPGVQSIKDLDDPWGTKRWVLGGEKVSLDGIEHGLLRPIYNDPRIHFAVNCAAIGCPPLADFAYQGAAIDKQLERVTRSALRNPRYAKVVDGTLHLTKIMQWYGDDFTQEGWSPTAESIPHFVAKYGTDEARALVDESGSHTPVEFVDYDWSLNDI